MSPWQSICALISCIALCFCIATVNAQDAFTVEEDTLIVQSDDQKVEVVAYGKVWNESNNSIEIIWERLINDHPSEWTGTRICDKNFCYPAGTATQSFVLAPGDTGNIDVHFVNDSLYGAAYVKMKLYRKYDSAASERNMHFYAENPTSTSSGSSSKARSFRNAITLYPNPVKNYLILKNKSETTIQKIELFNSRGSKVLSHAIQAERTLNQINVDKLERGIYIVHVYGQSNELLLAQPITTIR